MQEVITERQKDILFGAIAEYIRTASPVSSEDLRKRYRLPYSPATIRNELAALSDTGYLGQPHTSAGRVPTDKGYRWYVNKIGETTEVGKEEAEALQEIRRSMRDLNEFFRASTGAFADIVEALVISGSVEHGAEPLYKSGFRRMLSAPEFTEQEARNAFGDLIDSIDQDMRSLIKKDDFEEPRVYIGSENPIREARPYSMIIKTVSRDGVTGVIAILGSKRMRYDKGLSLFRAVDQFLNL